MSPVRENDINEVNYGTYNSGWSELAVETLPPAQPLE
jgi:hypothetical protein